ncbi:MULTISPECIES: LysR family transcriptional regulator [Alphaproteobacteria]|uniref:LysR family transcriptional regulator n=2 Tax=Sphingobium limneticum TaxID=1007511 RepID=A0A5J5HTP2_9SPHN|nr:MULTISPECIES: LysR family transcriptional regulator [Alphaproteobacteria]KAA9011145.1 LysR family transcriptional regulator [Sphingobium limneticum]KAA9011556.1 LysR family transcriptional regulator [Sphingobium limneticum]KAA9023757.1 LysR family transcriptional regulator [Sphingobium limneticum]MBJ7404201.1 LysR family transcriptional regulator [Bradyrhizobium sp.]
MTALIQVLAVAKHLSFHRAARVLGVSQSSVSSRVKALEDELGIVLFDRNTRGVRVTAAGRRFLDQVHEALGILDHAVKMARTQARGEEGELRIGVHALCQRRIKSRPFGGVKPGHGVTCRGEWREGVARRPLPPALA